MAIVFDEEGQRVFTANPATSSESVSIIELDNANAVTNVPLGFPGLISPLAIAFDATGQRVFKANLNGHPVSIIELADYQHCNKRTSFTFWWK